MLNVFRLMSTFDATRRQYVGRATGASGVLVIVLTCHNNNARETFVFVKLMHTNHLFW